MPRNSRRAALCFLTAAALALSGPLPVTPASAVDRNDHLVDQGEKIQNARNRFSCTVGLVDHEINALHTAGHCGTDGDPFYHVRADGTRRYLGFFSTSHDPGTGRGDIGTITGFDPALLGSNIFAPPPTGADEPPQPGDEICAYGQVSDRVRCGTVMGRDGEVLVTTPGLAGLPGDSGGPAWVEDRTVGVYTADWFQGWDTDISFASTVTLLNGPEAVSPVPPAVGRIADSYRSKEAPAPSSLSSR